MAGIRKSVCAQTTHKSSRFPRITQPVVSYPMGPSSQSGCPEPRWSSEKSQPKEMLAAGQRDFCYHSWYSKSPPHQLLFCRQGGNLLSETGISHAIRQRDAITAQEADSSPRGWHRPPRDQRRPQTNPRTSRRWGNEATCPVLGFSYTTGSPFAVQAQLTVMSSHSYIMSTPQIPPRFKSKSGKKVKM